MGTHIERGSGDKYGDGIYVKRGHTQKRDTHGVETYMEKRHTRSGNTWSREVGLYMRMGYIQRRNTHKRRTHMEWGSENIYGDGIHTKRGYIRRRDTQGVEE